jgi:arylsulfatase A-like enzyme/Flp pilus assembly protein TadD
VVLITLDTTRADHLGPYGYTGARTPTLDRLAAEGTLYSRAYSPAPETLPAHASLMTGLYPPSHGVRLNLDFRLPEEALTLAEHLQQRGFRTAAVTAAGVLNSRFGLDQGFEIYEDPAVLRGPPEWPAEEITYKALAATEDFGRERFFLWVHYYDPHSPFEPRAPFAAPEGAKPEGVELYDLEIAYMDLWVGKLLEGLEERGQLDNTAVVVVGDHGESLGDHGETYHTLFVYEATQRVPLILLGPGLPAGKQVDQLVASVDLFATILELLGVEEPIPTSSWPLPGLALGERDGRERRGVFSESMAPPLRYGWSALQGLRARQWLYIRAPTEELYDLAADPAQQVNLAYTETEVLDGMRGLLSRMLEEMPAASWEEEAAPAIGEEELRSLEALGYLGATRKEQLDEPLQGDDPKDMVEVAEAYQLARLARRQRRPDTAAKLLRFVVAADPGNFAAWRMQGELLFTQRRFEESTESLERALTLRPSDWRVLVLLAAIERNLGAVGAGEWYLREALRTSPFPAEVWRELGRTRLALRDWAAAAEAYRKVLEHEPEDERATWALQQLETHSFLDPETAPGAEITGSSTELGPG